MSAPQEPGTPGSYTPRSPEERELLRNAIETLPPEQLRDFMRWMSSGGASSLPQAPPPGAAPAPAPAAAQEPGGNPLAIPAAAAALLIPGAGLPVAAGLYAEGEALKHARSALAGSEKETAAQATAGVSHRPVEGADPREQGRTRLAALEAQRRPRVLGYTRGGFIPSTKSGVQETSGLDLRGTGYGEARGDFEQRGRAAAEGNVAAGTELLRREQALGEAWQGFQAKSIENEQQLMAEEDRALESAETRVREAINEFAQSGPVYEDLGTVFASKDTAGQIGMLGGLLLGILSGDPRGNPFVAAVERNIERRADIAKMQSEQLRQQGLMEQDAYGRLVAKLGNEQNARSAIRAMYLELYKTSLEQEARRIGIGAEDARLNAALADFDQKIMNEAKSIAPKITQQMREEQRYVPPQAIVTRVPTDGLDDRFGKGTEEQIQKYENELQKRGVHQQRAGLTMMTNGLRKLQRSDPSAFARITSVLQGSKPGADALTVLRSLGGGMDPGWQEVLQGLYTYKQGDVGKAMTGPELGTAMLAFGGGSPVEVERGVSLFAQRTGDAVRSLDPAYGIAPDVYWGLRQERGEEDPRVYDVRGVDRGEPVSGL